MLQKRVERSNSSKKKFNEVEVFIQRQSKLPENIEKYGKWNSFTLIPFMKKNEDLLKRKCFYEKEINKIKEKIDIIGKETNDIKEENNKNNKNKNKCVTNKERMKEVEKYFNNYLKLYENDKEFYNLKFNILSDKNIKKSIIPSFKSKNPISNLDINLNLLEPGIAELETNLKKVVENEELKIDEKEHLNQMNIELNKINDKFEIELGKENEENNLKENGINPPKNDNWGSVNDLGF